MKVTDEHELKLGAPAGFELPELPGEPLEPRVFVSTYYDTPDQSLGRAGITLRRRVELGVAVWQLKLPAAESRLELERSGGADEPPEELARLLAAHLRHALLGPIAELRTRRSGVLVDSGATRAEVVLDLVEVLAEQQVVSAFSEVEIELVSGDADGLGAIAKTLLSSGAEPADGTPKVFRALGRPDARADGRRGWVATQLAEILAHDPGTRFGADPEDLHQHRVAVRRLRAVLREEPLKSELRWLGGALGDVRDLDVLIEHLHAEARTLEPTERKAFAPLLTRLRRARGRARTQLLGALRSERYFALLDSLERAAAEEPPARDGRLPELAADEFRKLRKAVRRAGAAPDDETLHDLRKRGKRTRYAAELAATVDAKRSRRVVTAAKRLQDVLGVHQDSVVAEERLRGLLDEGAPAEQALAVGRLIERERTAGESARRAWPKAWRELEQSGKQAWR